MKLQPLTLYLCIAFLALTPWLPAQDDATPEGDGSTATPPGATADDSGNDGSDTDAAKGASEDDQRASDRARQQFARYLKRLDTDGNGKITVEEDIAVHLCAG